MKRIEYPGVALALLMLLAASGCGKSENSRSETSELKRLSGTYELVRSEVTFVGQPMMELLPPETTGEMTISAERIITQDMTVKGIEVSIKGSFELNLDDQMMMVDNDHMDLISKVKYMWEGGLLVTSVNTGTYFEKDFWRKL